MNYKQVTININDIESTSFNNEEPIIYSIEYEGINFEFLINFKSGSDGVAVMGSGAYEPEKFNPPVFQRHAWMKDIKCTSIFYNDPTLYLGKMKLGWGYGTQERHYLNDIAFILDKVLNKMEFERSKTLFYGSSGGGYMSLLLASILKGKALVNNPQTILTNYHKSFIENLRRPILKEDEEFIPSRVNAYEFFKETGYVPEIVYVQNMCSLHDVKKHFYPFIESLKEIEDLIQNKLRLQLYYNNDLGHSPLGKEETLELIESELSLK